MGYVSQSFKNDLDSARRSQREARKNWQVDRITKAGKPSKMAGDTQLFATQAEADAYVARIRALNPGTTFHFNVFDRNAVKA